MSAIKSPFLGNDKAALQPRDFIAMQGQARTRKVYYLYENGIQIGQVHNLKAAQKWVRS